MTDKRAGAVFIPFKAALYLLSLIYGLVIFTRSLFYKFGIFKAAKVPIKIISVGNLTLGGTGKTPFVIMLARILKEELAREASVLIRGYGWDEQALLKKSLVEVPILVGEDRVRAAGRAIKLYGSDTAVLDDGFQYWELERDLNIVLVDSRNPFGNGQLFPRGILREPKGAMKRADIVVFTKVNKYIFNPETLKGELKSINDKIDFVEAVHRPKYLYDGRARKAYDLSFAKGKRVMLISSIGDPLYFEETLKEMGSNIVEHIIFGDHHNYREADQVRIMKRCSERSFDLMITTEKDAVKLNRMSISFGNYTLMTLAVEMEITCGREILIDRLHRLYNS